MDRVNTWIHAASAAGISLLWEIGLGRKADANYVSNPMADRARYKQTMAILNECSKTRDNKPPIFLNLALAL